MKCYLCGCQIFEVVLDYNEPDKYEKWMGIENVSRQWCQCVDCGFIQSHRNYDLSQLEKIYKKGYRAVSFRGQTIKEAFDWLMKLPFDKSENRQRCEWLAYYTDKGTILDIGSGLGVFPVVMKSMGYGVECVEENEDSLKFIGGLGFPVHKKVPKKDYDTVSLIHVLEHIEDPEPFLRGLKSNMRKHLFVEVPDVAEFDYLDKDHDEFNSCHVSFFDKESLMTLLEKSGYMVKEMVSKFYKDRTLSRIMALCE